MKSAATSVKEYLAGLPPHRRVAIEAVRNAILQNLDADYEEGIQYGMIGYYVPHRVFPAGYHCDPKQPLPFAALASQKNYMSLYLMAVYCGCRPGEDESQSSHANWFRNAWLASGKKLDMGKACIRFKSIDDVPLNVVGEAVGRMPAAKWISVFQASLAATKKAAPRAKRQSKRPVPTKAPAKPKTQPRKKG